MSLQRFIQAQSTVYETALREINGGRKQTHWMWFIFPQLKGLGQSTMSQYYGITHLTEAREFLEHEILGPRLVSITTALLNQADRSALSVFGRPDDLKLQSSLTLFTIADDSEHSVFRKALTEFFAGKPDHKTLELLSRSEARDDFYASFEQ